MVYSALQTRRLQANLFNVQDNEYDVLVTSDAIGTGLNLNIRRVVFYGLSKYKGSKNVPVPASQVKQIAGRAGRRGSVYPRGLTTTLHLDDLDYLIECLIEPFEEVKKVGLFPFYEQVELFAGQLLNLTFSQFLEQFHDSCRLDGFYFLCQHDHIIKVANMLEKVRGLSLEDRFNFCFAPVVSMYLWLSNHFKEETFPYVKKAEEMALNLAALLGQSLVKVRGRVVLHQTKMQAKFLSLLREKTIGTSRITVGGMTTIKDGAPSPAAMSVEKVDLDQNPYSGKQAAGSRRGSEAETDTESGASSTEEGESPRSVAMWRRRKASAEGCLHSQVLKVMEEDLHLGEDTAVSTAIIGGAPRVNHCIVILSRSILPYSPLGSNISKGKYVR
ncbi:hypothetical protein SAY87_027544 [Trapa incisa]|uniref:Helicase C-terminal domain-containing protein n=1 Tax=Trapa incisa TaxID=236973 RepID=A0AAN7PQJ8_9MYRT|nr:hypothetical protein SAY87_027544 [Trapa incisa]